ncbi:Similar to Kdr: Vascular endothelial growth factor receptor 2 (Mus musculus) [Cotesia congregata]|uniref:Platelet-derived growth factor receptor-like protein n=1 Tax=Cotesia congregata TaxID=51543 RepID=A0A8J2E1D3_COTCN|nr:Similar to Kdr: Vascular endothelial growth factor receptor 2 (Mus musculus) [Cotesia congregata]
MVVALTICFSELTTPQEEIYIEEGKTLDINCTASEDIDFFYPKTINDQIVTSPVEFIVETALNSSKFILKKPNTVFGDTGWYGWIEASKNQRKLNLRNILVTPYSYNEIDIHWVYVYVKSEKKSLTSTSQMYHLKSPVGSDVNFPCYPTSPNYTVTLSYVERKSRRTVFMPLSEKLSYHPKKGFTLHNVNINDERKYLCDVPPPHKTNYVLINLRVKGNTLENSLEISSRPLQQITVAEDFSMNCTISTEKSYSYDTFRWITPLQKNYIRKFISYFDGNLNVHVSQLSIKNVTIDNFGEYKCEFYGFDTIKNAKADLQVHTESRLEMSMESSVNEYKKEVGQCIKWTLNITAYPLPKFKWLDPKSKEINNDWTFHNYKVNDENFSINLDKPDLTLEDRGNYTLIATNSKGTKTLDFFVDVLMKPLITKKLDSIQATYFSSNELLECECEAQGNPLPFITWEYTNNFKNSTENLAANNFFNVIYSPENISYSVSGDKHFSRFERQKTVYSDSGWYGCAIVSEKYKKINQNRMLFTPDICGELDVQWIYVFVKSTEYLFLDLPIHQNSAGEFVLESSGSDVTVPCRPTSSKYQVQLYAIEKEKTKEINISDETESLAYDAKKGFIFKNFTADSASFGCAIIKNEKQEQNLTIFRVTLTGESKKGDVPTITTFSLTHMEIGKNFSMNCTISLYEDREYFVQWVTPQLNNRTKETEYRITENENSLSANGKRLPQILNLELIIENVTAEDFGEYECFVYQYSKVESARINLVPHQHKHLDVSLKSSEIEHVNDFGNHAKLIISVDAYPLPEFNWYNPKGLEIDYQRRFFDYQINGETFSIELSSRELTHDDTGTHTLVAYNSEFKKTINFNVSILEPPSSVEEENLYMTNEKVRLQCQAKGYPVPTIVWQYVDEFDKLIGTSMTSNLFQNISTIVTDGLVTSIIIVKVIKEGFVLCVANNTMGENVIKKQRIKFAEQPAISNELFELDKSVKFKAESHHHDYHFGIMNQNINATEGGAIEMHCSASIDSFPNRIVWYNNSNSLETNERVAIDESKAASLYTSKLFITNLNKWDEGNYYCKGTTKEGDVMMNQYQLFFNVAAVSSTSIIIQISIILMHFMYVYA